FAMLRLPLSSTPFPYTTLFRSLIGKALVINSIASAQNCLLVALDIPGKTHTRRKVIIVAASNQRAVSHARRAFESREINSGRNQDRKSTRLNSSHQIISYAVFC